MTTRPRRDAEGTRRALLAAARRRFADDGYSGTTVRQIADDAGVNVALISRYFSSKEGLFEACLTGAASELKRSVTEGTRLEQMADSIAHRLAGPSAEPSEHRDQILLLLRSSGDERADQIRTDTLRGFAEKLATTAGWHPEHPDGDDLLLRAQLVLATAFGVVMMRAKMPLEPLASARHEDFAGPLGDLVRALLGRRTPGSQS